MKMTNFILAIAAAAVLLSGCSAALQSTSGRDDGMYGVHDKIQIANRQRERAELQRAEAEARRAELEARIAEAQTRILEEDYYYGYPAENYSSVLADNYESAYLRRLRGFSSPTYRLPSSYYDFRYGGAFDYVTAYDPAFYNVMVSGDQVWVEPKYISSMFGTWGATNVTMRLSIGSGSWYYGWSSPYCGAWWGFPHYSWYDWNWGICYNPYHYWGYGWGAMWGPYWGPSWGHAPSHGHLAGHWNPRPHRENIVNRPSYTSPSSGKHYGSNAVRGSVNGSGTFRQGNSGVGSSSGGGYRYNSSTTSRPSSGRTGTNGSGSANTDRRGSSSFFNYDNNRSNSRSTNSYNNNSYRSSGSSSGFSGGGSGGSGSSSGGHRYGNSLGR